LDWRQSYKTLQSLLEEEGNVRDDMIISDPEMTEMDGYTFTRKVRNDSRPSPTVTSCSTPHSMVPSTKITSEKRVATLS